MGDAAPVLFGSFVAFPPEAKQLMLAALLGIALGAERAWHRKTASIRTFALMCTGSCLFTLLSVEIAEGSDQYDPGRIAAQVVTGIGFIGGGVIFKTTDRIEGITTGAMIFIASAIGMAVGFNRIDIAWWGVVVYMMIHIVGIIVHRLVTFLRGPQPKRVGITPRGGE